MDDTAWSHAAPMSCPACGAEGAGTAKACTRCRAPIGPGQTACLECGAEGAGVAEVCARCGALIGPWWPVAAGPGQGSSRRQALFWGGIGVVLLVTGLVAAIGLKSTSSPAAGAYSPAAGASSPAASASSPAASASSPAANQLTGDQLKQGDCLAGSNMGLGSGKTWPDYVTVVACTKPHEAEVFFASAIWPKSLAYPGVSKVESQGLARCEAEFAPYDGIEYQQSALAILGIAPDSAVWAEGDRSVQCLAYEPDKAGPSGATPVNTSIKGTDQ